MLYQPNNLVVMVNAVSWAQLEIILLVKLTRMSRMMLLFQTEKNVMHGLSELHVRHVSPRVFIGHKGDPPPSGFPPQFSPLKLEH